MGLLRARLAAQTWAPLAISPNKIHSEKRLKNYEIGIDRRGLPWYTIGTIFRDVAQFGESTRFGSVRSQVQILLSRHAERQIL